MRRQLRTNKLFACNASGTIRLTGSSTIFLSFATTSLDHRLRSVQIACTPRKDFADVDRFSELLRASASSKRCPDPSKQLTPCPRFDMCTSDSRAQVRPLSAFMLLVISALHQLFALLAKRHAACFLHGASSGLQEIESDADHRCVCETECGVRTP